MVAGRVDSAAELMLAAGAESVSGEACDGLQVTELVFLRGVATLVSEDMERPTVPLPGGSGVSLKVGLKVVFTSGRWVPVLFHTVT